MVWTTIWNDDKMELISRTNEKFDRVFNFVKDSNVISEWNILHEWTSPRVIVVALSRRYVFDCTVKQCQQLKEVLEG